MPERDPIRPVRMDDHTWEQFGLTAGPRARSALLRQFVLWYTRTPGARLPARPAQEDTTMRAHTPPPAAANDR